MTRASRGVRRSRSGPEASRSGCSVAGSARSLPCLARPRRQSPLRRERSWWSSSGSAAMTASARSCPTATTSSIAVVRRSVCASRTSSKSTSTSVFRSRWSGCIVFGMRASAPVIHGAGYDQPSFSHFTSASYWHTGAPEQRRGVRVVRPDGRCPRPSRNAELPGQHLVDPDPLGQGARARAGGLRRSGRVHPVGVPPGASDHRRPRQRTGGPQRRPQVPARRQPQRPRRVGHW